VFADYVVIFEMLHPWLGMTANSWMIGVLFMGVSALAVASHARTMLTDPGVVPMQYRPGNMSILPYVSHFTDAPFATAPHVTLQFCSINHG